MIGSSIVSMKLAYALTKDMVNTEAARRLMPNVLDSSKRWILNKIHQQHQNYQRLASDEDPNSAEAIRHHEENSTEYLVHHWLEALFAWFQVIVLWHEPRVSLCAISSILSSFLLLTYFAPRFYATIMIALFLYNLNKFWFRHIWPEIRVPPGHDREEEQRLDVDRWTYLHPQLMTLNELRQTLEEFLKSGETHVAKLFQLRQQRPIAFATIVCSIFSCTAYLGNRISGMSLVLWALAGLMTAPGIYVHLLPEHTKSWLLHNLIGLKALIVNISNREDDDDEDDEEEDDDSQLSDDSAHESDGEEEVDPEARRRRTRTRRKARTDRVTQDQAPSSSGHQAETESTNTTAPKEENLIELDGFVML